MKIHKKIFLTFIACISILKPGLCDSIITEDGSFVNGKINTVLSDLVVIDTKSGTKRIVRDLNAGVTRDIVEIGYFKKQKITGRVIYYDDDKLELKTDKGLLFVPKNKVRNIILAQDAPNF
jgi:hypothetical protein